MSVHSLRNSVHNAFATKHLFRDCFARNFENSLVQSEWDTLAVRTALWATVVPPTRGTQQRFVNTQTKMLSGYPRALFVKPTKRRIVFIDQSKSSRAVFTTQRQIYKLRGNPLHLVGDSFQLCWKKWYF